MNIEKIRKDFGLSEEYAYFNSALASYPPKPVLENVFHELWNSRFPSEEGYFDFKSRIYDDFTETAANFINCNRDEIIGIDCTSLGANYIAGGMQLSKNDNVILNNFEFVSLYQPFFYQSQQKGFEVRVLELENADFSIWDYEKLVDENTKLVALSLVEFSNGYRFNLEEIAEFKAKHNIPVFIDAIQGTGAIKIDAGKHNIDFLSGGSSKWFSGFHGYGIFYIRKDLISSIRAPFSFFHGIKDQEQATKDYKSRSIPKYYEMNEESMNKFIVSTENLAGKICLTGIMKYMMDIGQEKIENRILDFSSFLTEKLIKKGYIVNSPRIRENMSGIVSFVPEKDCDEFVKELKQKNIFVSHRYGGIRVSIHFFNTEEEINRFLKYV